MDIAKGYTQALQYIMKPRRLYSSLVYDGFNVDIE